MNDADLDQFVRLDDTDVWSAIKAWQTADDFVLSTLSKGLIDRYLFKMELTNDAPDEQRLESELKQIAGTLNITPEEADYFVSLSNVSTNMYSVADDSIDILYNDGSTLPITTASDMLNLELLSRKVSKYAYCHIRIK